MNKRKDLIWSSRFRSCEGEQAEVSAPVNKPSANEYPPMMPPIKIEASENRIYFYAEVSEDSILQLNRILFETSNILLWRSQVTQTPPAPIYLFIQSPGGSVFSGLSAMDEIINCKVPVITVVDGIAASAATLMSTAGHVRAMKRHSFILIHQVSSAFWGTYENFQDEKENLDALMNIIKTVYKNNTKIPMKKLNEILKRDLYISAEDAKAFGLIDEII